jgi:hypothetical protein
MARLRGINIDVALAMRVEDPGLSAVENSFHPQQVCEMKGSLPANDPELTIGSMLPVRGARVTDASS